MGADFQVLVLDGGADTCKAGIAGESSPRIEYHTNILPIQKDICDFGFKKTISTSNYQNPTDKGIVMNSEVMEKIWNYTFYDKLKRDPMNYSVIITESPFNTKENREKTMTIMFETFCVPSFYMENTSVLSLFASGQTTGVVLDIGENSSQTVPVYEGYAITHAMRKLEFGGRDLTQWMMAMLKKQWYSFYTPKEIASVYKLKEKCCYVADNLEKELLRAKRTAPIHFKMPYDDIVSINEERFLCPEILFKPSICGSDSIGVGEALINSINDCDDELNQILMDRIVVSGGSTMFNGFQKRLEREISECVPMKCCAKVTAAEDRKYSAWIGGSILGCLSTFPLMAVTRAEFDEVGPRIVNLKCF